MKQARAIFLISSLCFTLFSLCAQVLPARTAFQSGLANVVEHYPSQFKILAGEDGQWSMVNGQFEHPE